MASKKSKDKGKGKGDKGKQAVAADTGLSGYPAFDAMQNEMERVMQRFFTNPWMAGMPQMWNLTNWPAMSADTPFASLLNLPKADLSENDDRYELNIELPGLDEKDVDVTLTERALVLKGEKKSEKETGDKNYHFTERSYGAVHREFALPSDVDRDAMKASFSKGVLRVTLPKTDESKTKAKRIEVTAS